MAAEIFSFWWPVYEGAYYWQQGATLKNRKYRDPSRSKELEGDWWLVAGMAYRSVKHYAPLNTHTALFKEFAETEPTQEGVMAFAAKYGLLTEGEEIAPKEAPSPPPYYLKGEPLMRWSSEIAMMRFLLNVWELAKNADVEGITDFLQREGVHLGITSDTRVGETSTLAPFFVAPPRLVGDGRPDEMDPPTPAPYFFAPPRGEPRVTTMQEYFTWYYLRVLHRINECLEREVSPRLHWNLELNRPVLRFTPHDLLGALWLQFAEAISGNKEYRQCLKCHAWFELSPDVARTNKLYCSTACRSRAFRDREEAKRLYKAGTSIEQIAKLKKEDPKTVKEWVESKASAKEDRNEGEPDKAE